MNVERQRILPISDTGHTLESTSATSAGLVFSLQTAMETRQGGGARQEGSDPENAMARQNNAAVASKQYRMFART
jgi:hypothetical protein